MDEEVFETALLRGSLRTGTTKEEGLSLDEAEELQELVDDYGIDADTAREARELMDAEGLDEDEAIELAENS